MRLFRRNGPRDTSALYRVARHGTIAELERIYDARWVNLDLGFDTLLTLALSNSDTTQRVAIAHRLLDDGADVLRERPLHVLLGRNDHDFVNEALLLERMLEQGADVNEIYPGFGTPLETIAAKFKFSDVQLAPFYDVLLARPDLDLLQQSLADRGIPIPPPEP